MRTFNFVLTVVVILLLSGCTDIGSPFYDSGSSYRSPHYYDPYDRSDSYYDRQERRKLERERERIENERERLERERERQERNRPGYDRPSAPPPSAPRPQPERCPSGFSPSEQKCSSEERRRGCQDIRLPGGLGCVRR